LSLSLSPGSVDSSSSTARGPESRLTLWTPLLLRAACSVTVSGRIKPGISSLDKYVKVDAGRLAKKPFEDSSDTEGVTVANYRQTVLAAFRDVEDNLAALRVLEKEAQQQNDAVSEARRGVELFTARYEGGVDPYLQVVSAQTVELANERNAIDILRRRLEASVLLIKGLGGGWDVSKLPPIASMH